MGMLFEKAPDAIDVPSKKKGRKKAAEAAAPAEAAEAGSYRRDYAFVPSLGMLTHTYACADEACGAECHDIIDEFRGEWLLQCCFCGTMQTQPSIEGVIEPKKDEFVFRDGRFAGQGISEVLRQPRGEDYVRWAAKEHKREAVRQACQAALDSLSTGL